MKKHLSLACALALIALLFAERSFACTTFCLKNKTETLFGRNYDWMIGDGVVVVNKRGVEKTSVNSGAENPARWTSRYGSVTFNQYGRENPMGGMNEAGLVVELMWLDEARYPAADRRPTVDVLEWVQYNLDTAATVDEVLRNAEKLRIVSRVTLHYLVSDREGRAATIEYLDGRLVARTGRELVFPALANDTYEKSLDYAKAAPKDRATSESSFDRFTRAAGKTKEFAGSAMGEKESIDFAFAALSGVAQRGYTQWSIVYDQKRGRIHFRSLASPAIKTIDAPRFDYSCGSAVKIFDVNAKDAGDVTARFVDYTTKANRDLVERSFSGTPFLKEVPAVAKDLIAAAPETFACAAAATTGEAARAEEPQGFFGYLGALYRFFFGA